MKLLLAIAPERFRDEELEIPRRTFEEAGGIGVDIASTVAGTCTGGMLGGGAAEATMTFEDANPDDYAGIVIVGGSGSEEHLWGKQTAPGTRQVVLRAGQGRRRHLPCAGRAGTGGHPRRAAGDGIPEPGGCRGDEEGGSELP